MGDRRGKGILPGAPEEQVSERARQLSHLTVR
jgi:hypothetical protein